MSVNEAPAAMPGLFCTLTVPQPVADGVPSGRSLHRPAWMPSDSIGERLRIPKSRIPGANRAIWARFPRSYGVVACHLLCKRAPLGYEYASLSCLCRAMDHPDACQRTRSPATDGPSRRRAHRRARASRLPLVTALAACRRLSTGHLRAGDTASGAAPCPEAQPQRDGRRVRDGTGRTAPTPRSPGPRGDWADA